MTAPRCPLELPIVRALLAPFFPSAVCRARFVRAPLMPSDTGGSFRLSAMVDNKQQTSRRCFLASKKAVFQNEANPNREILGLGSTDPLSVFKLHAMTWLRARGL